MHFWFRESLMALHILLKTLSPYFSLMSPAKPEKQSISLIKLMPISKTNHIFFFVSVTTPKNQGRGGGFLLNQIPACRHAYVQLIILFIAQFSAIIVHNSLKHFYKTEETRLHCIGIGMALKTTCFDKYTYK